MVTYGSIGLAWSGRVGNTAALTDTLGWSAGHCGHSGECGGSLHVTDAAINSIMMYP